MNTMRYTITHTLYLLALLLLVGTAQAQDRTSNQSTDDSGGQSATMRLSVSTLDLQPGTNIVLTTLDGTTFTVDMAAVNDTIFGLLNPEVQPSSSAAGAPMALTPFDGATEHIDCPDDFEARYVADETRQYQMAYCTPDPQQNRAIVHVNGTFGRGTVGTDPASASTSDSDDEPQLARRGLTRQDVQMKTGQGFAPIEIPFWVRFPEGQR